MAQQSVHPEKSEQRSIGFKSMRIYKDQTLGRGSYGAVYKAKCDDLLCAAKILHPTLTDEPTQHQIAPRREHRLPIRRFDQECEFMGAIKHPNIVQFLGMERDPDTNLPVLLMELMDDSLTHFLESLPQSATIPYRIQVNICHDITLALSFLHSNNIVHRDLSSNNVLLTGCIQAKVTDFGMAKLYDSEARTHLTLTVCPGTDPFMPPEAIKEPPVYTAKIDSFSFGVLIIQILTHKYPKPSNRQKEVRLNYPELPTGKAIINVPEIERRQNHISEIDPKHPLLPIAFDCLNDEGDERPSAHQLCEQLEALKRISDYTESIPQFFSTTERILMWQCNSEIQNLQRIKDHTNKQRKKQLEKQKQGGIDQEDELVNQPPKSDIERGIAKLILQPNPSGNSKPQQQQEGASKHVATAEKETKHLEQREKERDIDSIAPTVSLINAGQCASTQLECDEDAIVQFSVYYDVSQSRLRVHLQQASNLPRKYDRNECLVQYDPFVMLLLDPDRETALQSQVIKSTNDPVFNESFQFGKMSFQYIKSQTLVLRFYNHAQSNQVIGKVYVPLCNLEQLEIETIMQVKIIHEEEVEV